VQFIGAVRDGQWNTIWQAKVENKCRFFMWLLLQTKLPTADQICKYNDQANPICTLCHTTAEKHLHMVAKCSYAKAVWQQIVSWFNIQTPPSTARMIRDWWRILLRWGADDRAHHTRLIIYTLWNIWKERCRRVFQHLAVAADQLARCIRHGILAYRQANKIIE
jgi:hypothetical protein